MHPILGQFRRMVLYLIAWIPLAILLAYLLGTTHAVSEREALALAFPLCLIYAFVCLSAWYPCRVTPLDQTKLSTLLVTHATGAVVATALWILAGKLLAVELANASAFRGLERRFSAEIPASFGSIRSARMRRGFILPSAANRSAATSSGLSSRIFPGSTSNSSGP